MSHFRHWSQYIKTRAGDTQVPVKSSSEREDQFPAEWEANLKDLQEMGFEEGASKRMLIQTDGKLKEAIKRLVTAERAQ